MESSSQRWRSVLLGVGLVLGSIAPAAAVPVATMTWRTEGNPSQFCVYGTYANASFDVFGTLVNFGTDIGGFLCTGSFTGTSYDGHCASTLATGMFDFDFSVPATGPPMTPPVDVAEPFVGNVTSYTGTIAAAIGSASYTFDGTQVFHGEIDPSTTIPGCPIIGSVAAFEGQGGLNAFQTTPTAIGTDVPVSTTATFFDPDTGAQRSTAIDITFTGVTTGGNTLVTATSSAAGDLTSNFSVNLGGFKPAFFDITTDAVITPPITVCQHYDDANNDGYVDGTGVAETDLHILHGEGSPIVFTDRTVSVDTVNNVICAQVDGLSPFVVAVQTGGASEEHDSVVLPVSPVKVTIPKKASVINPSVVKKISVKVQNADLSETAGHTIQLALLNNTCPASVVLDSLNNPVQPDFVPSTAAADTQILVPGGKVKVAKVPLTFLASDYTTPNAKSPVRCTLTFVATTIAAATVIEDNTSNNQVVVDVDVIDKNDF